MLRVFILAQIFSIDRNFGLSMAYPNNNG